MEVKDAVLGEKVTWQKARIEVRTSIEDKFDEGLTAIRRDET
jgi:hypothetical protein